MDTSTTKLEDVIQAFIIGAVLILGILAFIYFSFIRQDTTKCAYNFTGKIQGAIVTQNITLGSIDGQTSGEIYCKDISKFIWLTAVSEARVR